MSEPRPTAPAAPILWTLFYRHGHNPNCELVFEDVGPVDKAVARAKLHCTRMGYRFIYCRETIVNLLKVEKERLGDDFEKNEIKIPEGRLVL